MDRLWNTIRVWLPVVGTVFSYTGSDGKGRWIACGRLGNESISLRSRTGKRYALKGIICWRTVTWQALVAADPEIAVPEIVVVLRLRDGVSFVQSHASSGMRVCLSDTTL